jgi:hypothetical protein
MAAGVGFRDGSRSGVVSLGLSYPEGVSDAEPTPIPSLLVFGEERERRRESRGGRSRRHNFRMSKNRGELLIEHDH